jgi:hypothetical protein
MPASWLHGCDGVQPAKHTWAGFRIPQIMRAVG